MHLLELHRKYVTSTGHRLAWLGLENMVLAYWKKKQCVDSSCAHSEFSIKKYIASHSQFYSCVTAFSIVRERPPGGAVTHDQLES